MKNLTKEDLVVKLQDIEWEDFEVKEAKSEVPKSAWETVSAFSNTAGGWLVFGAKKEGKHYEITGTSSPEKVSEDFLSVLRTGNKFNKRIDPEAKKYEFGDKTILAFYIPQRHPREKPVYYDSLHNTFIRTGSGDRRATQEEIDSFHRNASFQEKDNEPLELTFDDLDPETVRQYRNFFTQINPTHRYLALNDRDFLEKMSVIKDGHLTYGGLLVFGTDDAIRRQIPNYRIEYLEIPGTSYADAKTRYDFRISSESNLFQTFFQVYERLLKKIEIPFSIRQGVRDDDPAHLQALREALVNLIIHTDYFSRSSPRIRVFLDRFEFYNPGPLPKRIELILKEDFSLPRNPIIAKLFRYIKFSENIGSGFSKMFDGWQAKYRLLPVIEGDFDYYRIIFPTKITTTSTTTKLTGRTTSNTITKTITKGDAKEKEILELITNNPRLSAAQLAPVVHLTEDGVRYHIKNLKEKGIIKRKGHGRGGSWKLIKR